MMPDIDKQPEVLKAAKEAGKLLKKRLTENYNRDEITQNMQIKLMDIFKSTT